MTNLITRNDLARMYPHAPAAWLDAFIRLIPILFPFYKISRLRWVHFLGQIAAETDGLALNPMRENMGYDAAGLLKHFSYRLNKFIADNKQRNPPTLVLGRTYSSAAALANAIQYKKDLIADIVYGNREGTPFMQGHLYIGRGPAQTTHLNGYKAIGAEIARQPGGGVYDLVANPDLLATDPELGVRAAFANFEKEGLWMWADRDDCDTLSDALNTGNIHDNVKPHGLPRRRSETARAKAIWPADSWKDQAVDLTTVADAVTPSASVSVAIAAKTTVAGPKAGPTAVSMLSLGDSGPEVERLQERLAELGFQLGDTNGEFGKLTKRAVVSFQAEHELRVDGIVGPRTWEVLAQADVPDLGPREQLTAADLREAGSRTVAVTQKAKKVLIATKIGSGLEFLDQYFNIGFTDKVISKAEQVQSLFTRGKGLTDGLVDAAPTAGEHGLIMAACIIAASIAFVGWLALHMVQGFRVQDARSGANLAR